MTHPVESALGDRAIFESGALHMLLEAMQDGVIITTAELNEPGPVIIFVKPFERMTAFKKLDANRNGHISSISASLLIHVARSSKIL